MASSIPGRGPDRTIKRSRRGCAYCRKRKIKCDEQLPSCGECVRTGRHCDSTSVMFRHHHQSSFATTKHQQLHQQQQQQHLPLSSSSPSSLSPPQGAVASPETPSTSSASTIITEDSWIRLPPIVSPASQSSPSAAEYNTRSTGRHQDSSSRRNGGSMIPPTAATPTNSYHAEVAKTDLSSSTPSQAEPGRRSISDATSFTQMRGPGNPQVNNISNNNNDNNNNIEKGNRQAEQYLPLSPESTRDVPRSTPSAMTNNNATAAGGYNAGVEEDRELSFFLRHFSESPGRWMDLFDLDFYYSRQVPVIARRNPLVKYAACALAAKQLGRVHGRKPIHGGLSNRLACMETPWPQASSSSSSSSCPSSTLSLFSSSSGATAPSSSTADYYMLYGMKYYDKSISLLMGVISADGSGGGTHRDDYNRRYDDETIVAATILCIYEFLSATTTGWSRHLDGTQSLLRLTNQEFLFQFQPSPRPAAATPTPPKALRAAFWNFARQDFLASLISGKHTRLNVQDLDMWRAMGLSLDEHGLLLMTSTSSNGESEPLLRDDMIANTLVWLISRITNFIAAERQPEEQQHHQHQHPQEALTPTSSTTSPVNSTDNNHNHNNTAIPHPHLRPHNPVVTHKDTNHNDNDDMLRESTWRTLDHELTTWHASLPDTFQPSARIRIESLSPSLDTETWYSNSMCASTVQSYHMARMLMLLHRPARMLLTELQGQQQRPRPQHQSQHQHQHQQPLARPGLPAPGSRRTSSISSFPGAPGPSSLSSSSSSSPTTTPTSTTTPMMTTQHLPQPLTPAVIMTADPSTFSTSTAIISPSSPSTSPPRHNHKYHQKDLLSLYKSLQSALQSHALEICSIALGRPDDSTRIHMLQPLYFSGRCMTDPRDQAVVKELIRSIERDMGWATEYRVEQLVEEWGCGGGGGGG